MIKSLQLKKFGLLVIGIIGFQCAFSQQNYMPGYVIRNNADTLHGFIDYRQWEENPGKIKFRASSKSEPVTYTPTDITEFNVADEIYVSAIVDVEVTPLQTENLVDVPQVNMRVDTAFLQTLLKGFKSLYFYKSPDGRESFYIKQDSAFELLVYKRYIKNNHGKKVVMENKRYMGQLTLYLADCNKINSRVEHASYTGESLTELFQYYNKCMPSEISFQKKSRRLNMDKGFLAGASRTSLQFKSSSFKELVNANYPRSNNISAGFYLDFIMPRNLGKWSIYNELLISSYGVSGQYDEITNENKYIKTYTSVGMTYLKLNNMIRYKHPVGKINMFINGGISNGMAISEMNYKRIESKLFYMEREEISKALNFTRGHEQGWIVGAGATYNRLSLEFRYERSNGMSESTSLSSRVQRVFCLFGYRL